MRSTRRIVQKVLDKPASEMIERILNFSFLLFGSLIRSIRHLNIRKYCNVVRMIDKSDFSREIHGLYLYVAVTVDRTESRS